MGSDSFAANRNRGLQKTEKEMKRGAMCLFLAMLALLILDQAALLWEIPR